MIRYVLVLLLAGCSSVDHETRSLVCLGFCTEQRMEHKAGPVVLPKKEKVNEADDKAP
jgi:hypothetical protein